MDTEVKNVTIDTKPEVKEVVKEDFNDIFVNENDTFEVVLKYYKKDGKIFTDSGLDDDFDVSVPCKEIKLTLKYPDQSDCTMIASASPKIDQNVEKLDMRDLLSMELIRLIILMRSWSVDKPLTRESIMNLNTKIVKGLIAKIRIKIGMEGIF